MTERKAFKRRVRAQMDVTGQSYAQAAAQLEAGNPAHRRLTHPASAVAVALLRSSGLTLAPEDAFLAGGGIGFMYALFQYREVPHPLLTLVCQHHPQPWAPGILERLGIAHSARSGKRELTRLLGEGRSFVLPVTRGTIPWLAADPLTDREEHVVLALPGEQSIRIFDGTGSHARLDEQALVAGYLATGRKHPLVWLDESARLPGDLRPGLDRGLRATVAAMTGPVLGNSFDVNFGLSGLRKWAERVADPGADGWGRLFTDPGIWRRRLVECIDVQHTAPTAGRPLFAKALRKWGHAEAAGCFDRSARHWRAVATAADEGDLDLATLAAHVVAIAEQEAAGIAVLERALGTGGR